LSMAQKGVTGRVQFLSGEPDKKKMTITEKKKKTNQYTYGGEGKRKSYSPRKHISSPHRGEKKGKNDRSLRESPNLSAGRRKKIPGPLHRREAM